MTNIEVQKQIAHLREIMKPTPVRPHHIPRWFAKCLKPYRKVGDDSWQTLQRVGGRWLDHWGSTIIARRHLGKEQATDQVCFVSEPYGFTAECAVSLTKIAATTGIVWSVDANSWWYPGYTIRIVIEPPEGPPPA